jgi:hypothetical protein
VKIEKAIKTAAEKYSNIIKPIHANGFISIAEHDAFIAGAEHVFENYAVIDRALMDEVIAELKAVECDYHYDHKLAPCRDYPCGIFMVLSKLKASQGGGDG